MTKLNVIGADLAKNVIQVPVLPPRTGSYVTAL